MDPRTDVQKRALAASDATPVLLVLLVSLNIAGTDRQTDIKSMHCAYCNGCG